jgi:FecR protein
MKQKSCLLVIAMSVALMAASASAQEVGTATAVNPLSESTPPGGAAAAPLVVGAHIVHNEKIHTSPAGTVQLRFTDQSSMSIAPNTEIVINEYVYDPNSKNGHMLVTLTDGALRFVGGQLSHSGNATITTTAASIGIRGGTATVIKDAKGTEVINHFGYITLHNGGGEFLLTHPDFGALAHDWNRLATDLGLIPQNVIAYYLVLFTSKNGEDGGVPGFHVANIGHCGFGSVQGSNCPNTLWSPNNGGELDANQILGNSTNLGVQQTPPRWFYNRGR